MSITSGQLIAFLGDHVIDVSAADISILKFPTPLNPGRPGGLPFAPREDKNTTVAWDNPARELRNPSA